MRILAGLVLATIAALPAAAQTRSTELEPLNFSFAAYVGSGIYASGAQTVWLVRVPVTIPVLEPDGRPFGLRVRLRGTVGFFDFDPASLRELALPDSVGTASLLAGVDFPVPIYANWTLAPFLDVGPAWDTETDVWAGVVGVGAWSRAQFPWQDERLFVLRNEIVRAENFGSDNDGEPGFGKLETELELRLPVGTVQERPLGIGPFVQAVWLFEPLELGGVVDEPRPVRWRYEVGVKAGAWSKERVKGMPLPRLGLSYRFGQGVTSVRFIVSTKY